ncbi:MAG: type II toxin-antitoxin system RelE/ParE family toxin [Alphaproteobacteria bacterium]|nr:type II toxin-antitoxin system RelE/ParE family toxin [Alphaproteobacteria bacterium]
MRSYKVVFSPAAVDQLGNLAAYIAEQAGRKTAVRYIAKIEQHCKSLKTAPLRGRARDDLFPGLRIMGFGKRVNIAFSVGANTVIIHGVFYGGQDIDNIVADEKI